MSADISSEILNSSNPRITLVNEMIKRDNKKGLVTLCIGGGMGISMCIERD